MNRVELVNSMMAKTGHTKKATEESLKAFLDSVSEELSNGGKIQLVGFGTFETRKRASRKARNPQTGEDIKIPACTVPAFKAGKALKETVNK